MTRAYITTSWDDGHPLDLRLAGMLADHGLPGTFYVPRQWRLPTLSEPQVRELSDAGFELGGHTIDHVVLPRTPEDQARKQVRDSRRWLSDVTGQDCTMFCPPTGRFDASHAAMIADAGYTGYRTVEMWSTDLPRRRPGGLLELPTTLQAQPHGKGPMLRNILKRKNAGNLMRFSRFGRSGHWLDHLERVGRHVVGHGGVLHLWGHSWEVDQFNQWDRLGHAFALLGKLAEEATAMTNGDLCRRHCPGSTNGTGG